MNHHQPSPQRRETFARPGAEERAAAFLLVRGGRREAAPDEDAFSTKLTLERPFVAAPTD